MYIPYINNKRLGHYYETCITGRVWDGFLFHGTDDTL